ncbi:ABC permease [Bifidobacterium saguini DSM 23967]|uniref:ABC permease n=2 Tax=Bifidobacterium saguini TaxID=762210 RepID=A0A087DA20_9BIFI|nr:ABC transporter permease [Bifidobacterium saguini]KFI92370.1 ABC permease [Bifidobacterium saguini DSM 23967]QTB91069.1 ABC transporter permease [Bifidobacterium saguini]
MNTYKATVRVLLAHRTYIIVYLILMGIMMFSLSWSQLAASVQPVADTYEPNKVNIAVIDRDGNRGGMAEGLRDYLSESATMIELDDTAESLQQAVASNWVDLIVIIPRGYANEFLDAAQSGKDMPTLETVTSYTSGAGTIGNMNVNGFLSLTRIALIGEHVNIGKETLASWMASVGADGSVDWSNATNDASAFSVDTLPEGTLDGLTIKDVQDAAAKAADTAHDSDVNRSVVVEKTTPDAKAGSETHPVTSGFGDTMKTALYPLFLTLSVCVSLVARVFGAGELRRRLMASPVVAKSGLKRMLVLCGFALLICVGYLAGALILTAAAGGQIASLPIGGVIMVFLSVAIFSFMCVACGFMLGEFGASDMAANAFANVFGLLILFTSGIAFPMSMMPDGMVALAKLTPGWWYCTSIDNALGVVATTDANWMQWTADIGIVALFAVAFICIGLAAGKFRRSRPTLAAPATTELAEA